MLKYENLTKAQVLMGLYNASKPQGLGFLHYDPKEMTLEEAESLLEKTSYFDYLKGRVMKVNLGEDSFDEWGYDRDNGAGAAERVLGCLRSNDSKSIQKYHEHSLVDSMIDTGANLDIKTATIKEEDGSITMTLGLSDAKPELLESFDKIIQHLAKR